MTVPIRVLLVADDPLVLSGLKMMLAAAEQSAGEGARWVEVGTGTGPDETGGTRS